jgi:citrate lyase subunit beta/citryl-CoA lyase
VLAGLETVLAVLDARQLLAAPAVTACYFGAEDYVADLGGVRTIDNLEVLVPRSRVAMAARLAGVMALDQIVPDIADGARFSRDAAQGRSLGFAGKMCIHPAQVPWANAAFSSSAAEMDRARRVLAAAVDAEASGHGVFAFEGQMIDEPLLRQARSVLARGT